MRFHPDKYALSAGQVVRLLEGLRTVAVAERFLVNADGHAELMYAGHSDVAEIDAVFRDHYGSSAFD